MTPSQRYRARIQRLVRDLQPEVQAAVLAAFARLRDTWTEAVILQALESGGIGILLTDQALGPAFSPLRAAIAEAVRWSTVSAVRDIPRARELGVVFDVLNPRVITAVRQLDTFFVQQLTDDVRATVRQVAERTLVSGVNPRQTARDLRAAIGLGPTQEVQVQNFRDALEGKNGRSPFDYLKRDRRFDAAIKRGDLSPAQIDKMVDVYRHRRIALNAESVSRTAALSANKTAQRLSWDAAIERGIVDRADLRRRWISSGDARVRDEHAEVNGETVGYDELYSTGELLPGESTYQCRCIERVFLASP